MAQKILEVVKMNDYCEITVWGVIKRFIEGWVALGCLLVIYSCVKYHKYISAVFTDSILGWINLAIPILIAIFAVGYMIKSLVR